MFSIIGGLAILFIGLGSIFYFYKRNKKSSQTQDLTLNAPAMNHIETSNEVFVAPNSVDDIEVKREMHAQQLRKL